MHRREIKVPFKLSTEVVKMKQVHKSNDLATDDEKYDLLIRRRIGIAHTVFQQRSELIRHSKILLETKAKKEKKRSLNYYVAFIVTNITPEY